MVYHHYLRRLERLTICRFNYNCSTFSSCQGSNPGPLARQSDAQPTEPISRKLCLEDDRILAKSKQLVDVDTLVNLHFFYCFCHFQLKDGGKEKLSEFFKACSYVQGPYNEESGFKKLNAELDKLGEGKDVVNRLFYLALPPSVFIDASENIKNFCMSSKYVFSTLVKFF